MIRSAGKGPATQMIIGKDLVSTGVTVEDKPTKIYTEYNRPYYQHPADAPMKSMQKREGKKLVSVNGKIWEGLMPETDFPSGLNEEQIKSLVNDAMVDIATNCVVTVKVTQPDGTEKEEAVNPYLVMLKLVGNGRDSLQRNMIQAAVRKAQPKYVDPAEARENMIQALMDLHKWNRKKAEKYYEATKDVQFEDEEEEETAEVNV